MSDSYPPDDPEQDQGAGQTAEVTEPPAPERERRTLYRHPLAAVGGAMIVAGVFAFVVLAAVDIATQAENPYRSVVTFVAAPAVVTIGVILFLIAVLLQVRAARRRGEAVRFVLRIEISDPRYMRNLWFFLVLSGLFMVVVAWGGFKAYEATDSVGFCGESCHVMEPQNVTYANSPHARVPCVDCHIGPGASFWVSSKFDGIRQVYATATNSFDRPVDTPVETLRPAQETCEGCHWPEQFIGQKLVSRSYYRTTEDNAPWTISLLVNIGGGNPRTGRLEGIHWHMLSSKQVEYVATDDKRQEIPWVRVTDPVDGSVSIYTDPGAKPPDFDDPDTEIRLFDCMDCHNRPSHTFQPPATAMNLELSKGTIAKDLPFIRKIGLELLNAEYLTREEANETVPTGLHEFYAAQYPQDLAALREKIDQAAGVLLRIYNQNFFPDMKTDYRARLNNLSHFVNEGCFRCHFTDMENESGQRLSSDCEGCHTIVAQGPSDDLDQLTDDIAGLEFEHPVDIGEVWKRVKCTQCHTPASGY